MLSHAKTRPRAWTSRRNTGKISTNSNRFTRFPQSSLIISLNQQRSSHITTRSTLCRSPTTRPTHLKTTNTMALCHHTPTNHPCHNHSWQTPQSLQNRLCYAPALTPATPTTQRAQPTTPRYASRQPAMRSLVSTRIGFTKIPELAWMSESTCMVSVKIGGKTYLFANPKIRHTVYPCQEKVCLNLCSGYKRHTSSWMDRRAGDNFSVGYLQYTL